MSLAPLIEHIRSVNKKIPVAERSKKRFAIVVDIWVKVCVSSDVVVGSLIDFIVFNLCVMALIAATVGSTVGTVSSLVAGPHFMWFR
jgi:hypothetical protein